MYSKTNVLKKSSFNFIMHMLNTNLWDVNVKLLMTISQ